MDEKRPKRRKDKYNPYTLTEKEDKHFLSFQDGQGMLRELQITKELFEVLNRFELDDLSILNEWDRHYEHSELTEISLYSRAAMPRNRWRKRYFGTYDMRPCTELLSNCPKYRDGGSYYITLWGLHTHKSLKRRVVPFRPSGNPYRRLKKD